MIEEFKLVQVIDQQGELLQWEYEKDISEDLARTFYRHLIRIRTFDRKAVSLQRQGRIGTYAPYEGQEASQVGSALALKDKDWLFPSYRDHGATMTFGHSLLHILLFWKGRNEGCVPPEGKNIFTPGIPIATQLPHAVGAAYAEKRKGTRNAAIVYFGDGATSEGDFHEGLNLASVWEAPVVFFNQNNHYAISVPMHKQMKTKTIAQKALAYDIPSVRIDGNDIFAVYFETLKALERARNGDGPTLIESVTWRYGAHTTADDPTKYRDQLESESRRRENDPVDRLTRFMKHKGWIDEEWMTSVQKECAKEVDLAVEELEAYPAADPSVIFDYVFATPTWTIQEQKEKLLELLRGE
ncbi:MULTISPECIES: pyruvate dehydrogenase (acetyl-transferring) E1 component subunit alpha [unclassified Rossellomorea]|uniref:pyruvate dehydrogenase (acetyl-transferring) E1 component subunit alpha n=1 Tax=unclassified Rossellomorea TaxID=2837526 RepID=UPI00261310BF|nr:pyruvate dehydrogenase (acetyl-transferring) E1 component subunit alpha [uncultured Rossellomorea sp.]